RDVVQVLLGGVRVNTARRLAAGAAPALGLLVGRAGLLLRLPAVADLLVCVLQRRVRHTMGTLTLAVLLGGGVVRLGERPLSLLARLLDGLRQFALLRLATLGHLGHRSRPFLRDWFVTPEWCARCADASRHGDLPGSVPWADMTTGWAEPAADLRWPASSCTSWTGTPRCPRSPPRGRCRTA